MLLIFFSSLLSFFRCCILMKLMTRWKEEINGGNVAMVTQNCTVQTPKIDLTISHRKCDRPIKTSWDVWMDGWEFKITIAKASKRRGNRHINEGIAFMAQDETAVTCPTVIKPENHWSTAKHAATGANQPLPSTNQTITGQGEKIDC